MSCATLKRPLDSDLFSPNSRPATKRRRLAGRGLFGVGGSSSSSSASIPKDSPFASVSSQLSPEQMQFRLRHEIRYLRRLKHHFGLERDSASSSRCSSEVSSPGGSLANFGEKMKTGVGVSKECPLFTFSQVGLICERMLNEKEETLRQEYEQVLSTKLQEQYDTFVKFTHDQMLKNFQAASAPSYLS